MVLSLLLAIDVFRSGLDNLSELKQGCVSFEISKFAPGSHPLLETDCFQNKAIPLGGAMIVI